MDAKEVIATIRRAIQSVKDKGDSALSIDGFEDYLSKLEDDIDSLAPRELTQADLAHYAAQNETNLAGYRAKVDSDLAMFRSVIEAGQGALKWAIYINGAAAVALLAFLGKIWGEPQKPGLVHYFPDALLFFLSGVLFGSIAAGLTYLTQAFFSKDYKKTGIVFQCISIILVAYTYAAFTIGGWKAYLAFSASFLSLNGV